MRFSIVNFEIIAIWSELFSELIIIIIMHTYIHSTIQLLLGSFSIASINSIKIDKSNSIRIDSVLVLYLVLKCLYYNFPNSKNPFILDSFVNIFRNIWFRFTFISIYLIWIRFLKSKQFHISIARIFMCEINNNWRKWIWNLNGLNSW